VGIAKLDHAVEVATRTVVHVEKDGRVGLVPRHVSRELGDVRLPTKLYAELDFAPHELQVGLVTLHLLTLHAMTFRYSRTHRTCETRGCEGRVHLAISPSLDLGHHPETPAPDLVDDLVVRVCAWNVSHNDLHGVGSVNFVASKYTTLSVVDYQATKGTQLFKYPMRGNLREPIRLSQPAWPPSLACSWMQVTMVVSGCATIRPAEGCVPPTPGSSVSLEGSVSK